jgi:hypothetical protein
MAASIWIEPLKFARPMDARLRKASMPHEAASSEIAFGRASCWKETQLTYIVNESCIKCKYMDQAIRLLSPNVVN